MVSLLIQGKRTNPAITFRGAQKSVAFVCAREPLEGDLDAPSVGPNCSQDVEVLEPDGTWSPGPGPKGEGGGTNDTFRTFSGCFGTILLLRKNPDVKIREIYFESNSRKNIF